MTKKVFYWKKSEYLIKEPEKIIEVNKKNFKKLPITFTDKTSDEEIFTLLNKDNSPLTTKEMQKWIRENLMPNPHTSMSVCDIIEHNGKLLMCDYDGWRETKWKNDSYDKKKSKMSAS